jgi:hypothetical protein
LTTEALAINLDAPCFLWTGRTTKGYGVISIKGKETYVHRYMWEQMRGPIPAGLEIDHLCRVPRCVNPQHLEPVTHTENLRRGNGWGGRHARTTHCPKGHPYDEANTQYSQGQRKCAECHRVRQRAYNKQKRLHRAVTDEGIAEYRWSCR